MVVPEPLKKSRGAGPGRTGVAQGGAGTDGRWFGECKARSCSLSRIAETANIARTKDAVPIVDEYRKSNPEASQEQHDCGGRPARRTLIVFPRPLNK